MIITIQDKQPVIAFAEEIEATAFHEAGHLVVSRLLYGDLDANALIFPNVDEVSGEHAGGWSGICYLYDAEADDLVRSEIGLAGPIAEFVYWHIRNIGRNPSSSEVAASVFRSIRNKEMSREDLLLIGENQSKDAIEALASRMYPALAEHIFAAALELIVPWIESGVVQQRPSPCPSYGSTGDKELDALLFELEAGEGISASNPSTGDWELDALLAQL